MPNRQMAVDTFFGCSSGQMFIIAKERLLRPDRPLRRIRARERRPHRPYLARREIATPPALPLGLVPDQTYDLVQGRLAPGEQPVLLSDGVPEARSQTGELYGFERLPSLTKNSAQEIADAAKQFGQEDDITVLTLALATS